MLPGQRIVDMESMDEKATSVRKGKAPAGGTTGAKDGRLDGLGTPSVHNSAYALKGQFSNWPALPR